MLGESGLDVVEAASADQAIARLEADSSIQLVLTDVDMPGSMDGLKLAHYVSRQWPPVRIIVISGNHGNKVWESPYPKSRVLGYVIPPELN